jgi:hypothetical protein
MCTPKRLDRSAHPDDESLLTVMLVPSPQTLGRVSYSNATDPRALATRLSSGCACAILVRPMIAAAKDAA